VFVSRVNCVDRGGGWQLAKAFHLALKKSVGKNFGKPDSPHSNSEEEFPLINCMCHSQSTLLAIAALYSNDGGKSRRKLPVVRGSDDFWPFDEASHGPHLFANAMNSLLVTHIGVHDW